MSIEPAGDEQRHMILLYGGTFDPVHNGHVNIVRQAQEQLQAKSVHILPCFLPPHKETPSTPDVARLEMLQLVVNQLNDEAVNPVFMLDTQEFESGAISYTVDTLKLCRQRWGDNVALVWLIGGDSWQNLHRWHLWQTLTDYAHIAIARRPGYGAAQHPEQLQWSADKLSDISALRQWPQGRIVELDIPELAVSSENIRQQIAQGIRPAELLPAVVEHYIQHHGLYLTSHE